MQTTDRTLFQLVLIFSLCHLSWAENDFCHVPGHCQNPFFVRMQVEDYNACLAECKREPLCRIMSFLGQSDELNCELYQETECEAILVECSDCFSGQFRCHFYDGDEGSDVIPRGCRVEGVCEGDVLTSDNGADNLDDCNEACAQNAQCQWSSFNTENMKCSLWESCSNLSIDNVTFSSHVQCAPERFDSMILFLSQDGPDEILKPFIMCDSCHVHSREIIYQATFLTWVDGQLLTCVGGRTCHVFDMNTQGWKDLNVQNVPEVGIYPGKISSRELFTLETFSDKTHILDLNTLEFREHIPRPNAGIDNPCVVQFNETIFMAIGGSFRNNGTPSTATFIFDALKEEWIEGEPLRVPMSNHFCPLITKSDGSSYVLAFGGAQRHSYIYDPEDGFWRTGPNFPRDGVFQAHRLGNTILAEAVEDENHAFYELSTYDETWTALTSRHYLYQRTISLAIPEFLFQCPIACPS